jgi:predicted ATP-dependent serine protease
MKLNYNSTEFVAVKDIAIPDIYNRRLKTGIESVDKMFGDGMLPTSVITISSKAGLGKSTFVLQILDKLTKNNYRVGFCSSEESIYQVAFACRRLGISDVGICNENKLDKILSCMENMDVVVVDSFQGIEKGDLDDKVIIETLINKAKETECVLILICHLTKSGDMRGTNLLTYAVDVNMFIDFPKDGPEGARHVYFAKNRFGPGADYDCVLTERGFDFTPIESEGKMKVSRKDEERKQLLSLPGKITVKDVCKKLNIDATRANYLLRELTTEGKFQKRGKGPKATWTNTNVLITVESVPKYNQQHA